MASQQKQPMPRQLAARIARLEARLKRQAERECELRKTLREVWRAADQNGKSLHIFAETFKLVGESIGNLSASVKQLQGTVFENDKHAAK